MLFADYALFHDDGVFDDRALFNVNSAEKNAVFNGAVDDATVRDKAVFNLCVVKITGRNAVLDLCENRAFAIKNLVSGFGVQQFHTVLIVSRDIVDNRGVACDFVAVNFQRVDLFQKNVFSKSCNPLA